MYFGYSMTLRTAHVFVGFPDRNEKFVFENIQHFVPNNMALFLGADGVHGAWNGKMKKIGIKFGTGAFLNVNQREIEDDMPGFRGAV
jgi:hypothetical protein